MRLTRNPAPPTREYMQPASQPVNLFLQFTSPNPKQIEILQIQPNFPAAGSSRRHSAPFHILNPFSLVCKSTRAFTKFGYKMNRNRNTQQHNIPQFTTQSPLKIKSKFTHERKLDLAASGTDSGLPWPWAANPSGICPANCFLEKEGPTGAKKVPSPNYCGLKRLLAISRAFRPVVFAFGSVRKPASSREDFRVGAKQN